MNDYSISYINKVHTVNSRFRLHTHDEYEIFLFLEGDSHYVVEGKNYNLTPGDMIIIRRHEMHRIFHHSNALYSRFVLMINPSFFVNNNCPQYEKQFESLPDGQGNKIAAEVVRNSGLYDAYLRLKKYTNDFKENDSSVVNAVIIEFLHLLSEVTLFTHDDIPNKQIKAIITYINNNFTKSLKLEDVSSKFFISKYHLCHLFKKATGITYHRYITQKRITHVREQVAKGVNITNAVLNSGFNSYSSFYRAYTKEFGHCPKDSIKL